MEESYEDAFEDEVLPADNEEACEKDAYSEESPTSTTKLNASMQRLQQNPIASFVGDISQSASEGSSSHMDVISVESYDRDSRPISMIVSPVSPVSPSNRRKSTLLPTIKGSRNEQEKEIIENKISLHLQTIKKAKLAKQHSFIIGNVVSNTSSIATTSTKDSSRSRRSIAGTSHLRRVSLARVAGNSQQITPIAPNSPIEQNPLLNLLSEPQHVHAKKERHKLLINYTSSVSSPDNASNDDSIRHSLRRHLSRGNSLRKFDEPKRRIIIASDAASLSTQHRRVSKIINPPRIIQDFTSLLQFESLLRWNFAIPFDSRNCIVEISVASDYYNEYLYYKVISSTPPYRMFSFGTMAIDLAFDLAHQVHKSTSMDEDIYAVRSLFQNLFQQADVDQSGSLSFNEIQSIVSKINIGLSPQEISLIIAAADVDESGEVDYMEFVPLAVDMIQNQRTRSQAKQKVNDIPQSIIDIVLNTMDVNDLHRIAELCVEHLKSLDTSGIGAVSGAFLRSRLHNASFGLTPNEINMIVSSLPRDSAGRSMYSYNIFYEVLYEVRFISLKNIVLESQGTDLQKYLIDMCKTIESDYVNLLKSDYYHTSPGTIPLKLLINTMMDSERLGLTRLQILMICSEANATDGFVNMHQFVPMAVKMIELMFDPESLRLRAELIASNDLSDAALLEGESLELLDRRLKMIFTAHNVSETGELDANQFCRSIQSLGFNLTKSEVDSLLAIANVSKSGTINFSEFTLFVRGSLIQLVRERKLRALQRVSLSPTYMQSGIPFKTEMANEMLNLLQECDVNEVGVVDYTDLCMIFKRFTKDSDLLYDLMLSEVDVSAGFDIAYKNVYLSLSRLMPKLIEDVSLDSEKKLYITASILAKRLYGDELYNIAEFLSKQILDISIPNGDAVAVFEAVSKVIKNPNNGLSRTQSNLLLSKIVTTSDTNDNASLHDSCSKESIRLLLFRGSKLSIIRSLVYQITQDELATAINAQLHIVAKANLKPYEKALPLLVPICCCVTALEAIPFLNLSRTMIFSIIYWSHDSLFENLINRKSFALYAASAIIRLNSSEYLESRAYVLENSSLSDIEILDGLTPQIFLAHLTLSCPAAADANGDVFLDTFRAIMGETPKLRLTIKEILIFESNFVGPHVQKVRWEATLPWAYHCLLNIRRECKIGRRIGLAALQIVSDKKIAPYFRQVLVDLSENLLGLVKLVNKGGVVLATFPDAEKYALAMPEDNSSVGKGRTKTMYFDKCLNLTQYSISSINVNIAATLLNKGLDTPTILILKVEAHDLDSIPCTFNELSLHVPMIAEVDDELADVFVENTVANLLARYDGKCFVLDIPRCYSF